MTDTPIDDISSGPGAGPHDPATNDPGPHAPVDPALDALVDAALEIAAEHGWRRTTVREAAERAGVSRMTAFRLAPVKLALLNRLAARVDAQMLAGLDEDATDPEIPVRDRLFEALMLRFDALNPYRDGIVAVLKDLPRDPLTAAAGLPSLGQSMAKTLDAVGESTMPPLGLLRVKGLAIVWLATLRVWVNDDSADMSATMKALDSNLTRADELVNTFRLGSG
jgi:AcrR family transcriptional regulator